MTNIKDIGIEKIDPNDSDFLLIQEVGGITRHITRENLLKGIGGNGVGWQLINSSSPLNINSKNIITATSPITIELQNNSVGEVEIYNLSQQRIGVNLNGGKYNGLSLSSSSVQLTGINTYTRLLWVNGDTGWIDLSGSLETIGNYPMGMAFWLEGGSYLDRSGNNRHLTPLNPSTPPTKTTGLDNKQVLRWNGTGSQELSATPFLTGTTSATLYCVFTVSANNHYGLVRTQSGIGDYWRFTNNSAGYFGVFRNARYEAYPLNMPVTGSHLVSIHADGTNYEVIQNNVSKGVQSSSYVPGNVFRVGVNDLPFSGDIALLLLYPNHINKTSQQHLNILTAIKNFYPSLPFTL